MNPCNLPLISIYWQRNILAFRQQNTEIYEEEKFIKLRFVVLTYNVRDMFGIFIMVKSLSSYTLFH